MDYSVSNFQVHCHIHESVNFWGFSLFSHLLILFKQNYINIRNYVCVFRCMCRQYLCQVSIWSVWLQETRESDDACCLIAGTVEECMAIPWVTHGVHTGRKSSWPRLHTCVCSLLDMVSHMCLCTCSLCNASLHSLMWQWKRCTVISLLSTRTWTGI